MLSDNRRMSINELVEPELWKHVDLVILATCNSAQGKEVGATTDDQSLVDLFLSMGVSSVIGSFQPVSDSAATALFARFYSALADNNPPYLALATAQRTACLDHQHGWHAYGCWAEADR